VPFNVIEHKKADEKADGTFGIGKFLWKKVKLK
jgi:hypothetical protein